MGLTLKPLVSLSETGGMPMWRLIPLNGRTRYEINEQGVVRTASRHRIQRVILSNGYPAVWLLATRRFPKYRKCCYVHKLVAIMFWDCPKTEAEFRAAWSAERQVRHKDHNKLNPALSNLYEVWKDHAEGH